jgi:stage V sporulation protein G
MADNKLDIRVYPIDEPKGNTKAFASVAVDDLIAIRGVRVIDGEKGLFVSMPQSQDKKSGEYHDIAFPLNGDLRKEITKAVLEEYEITANLDPEHRGYDKPDKNAASEINVSDVKLDVRVYPLNEPQGNTKAFASVSVDDLIAIRGVRVVEGEKGLFVTMPQSQDKDKNYHDVAFPLVGDLRKEINKVVLNEYKATEKSADKSLANGLKKGTEKAAENAAVPKETAAKKSPGLGD